MPANIITTDDLLEFKLDLLSSIKELLADYSKAVLKKYLKSSEVRELLQISHGTLQTLRINGTLPYSKVGGIIFYEVEEIQKVMTENRIHHNID